MKDDPCFRCPLPDCDETSSRCVVLRLRKSYDNKHKHGRHSEVTEEERTAWASWFKLHSLERFAQAAEGVQPYNRAGSKWKHGEAKP